MAKKAVLSVDGNGVAIQGIFRPLDSMTLAVGAVSNRNTKPINAGIVRLLPTTDCHIRFGDSSVVATAIDLPILKYVTEYFVLQPNEYISVIQDSAGGSLFITTME